MEGTSYRFPAMLLAGLAAAQARRPPQRSGPFAERRVSAHDRGDRVAIAVDVGTTVFEIDARGEVGAARARPRAPRIGLASRGQLPISARPLAFDRFRPIELSRG